VPRIVVYAEGAAEALGSITLLPAVGEALREEMLGSAHILIRRVIAVEWGLAQEAVRFDAPNRTGGGRLARGSDLLHEQRLRQLLRWIRPERQQPDLAIVLIDADGDHQRGTRLRAALSSIDVVAVIGLAIEEFEAWLLADFMTVQRVLGAVAMSDFPTTPERLKPGEAKGRLNVYLGEHTADSLKLRREIAAQCSLDELRNKCRAFQQFVSDLRGKRP
jgi:hypothetical protein